MKIAIAGTGPLALQMMRALLESRHEIVALIQNGRKTRGIARRLATAASAGFAGKTSVIGLAIRNRLPVLWIDRMNEQELAPLRALRPDIILVGAFSIILKKTLIDLPNIGCINAHSSLLPKHRGPNPFSAVLLANETETGVTFHRIDEGIDTGDILDQFAFPISPTDTAMTLYHACAHVAGRHAAQIMDRVERQGIQGTPQDPAAATYDKKLEVQGAWIDWHRPADEIDRLLRAYKPLFLPRFQYQGRTILISRLTCRQQHTDAPPGTVIESRPFVKVATGQGAVSIEIAYTTKPIPAPWPMPWNRPKPSQRLNSEPPA